jgi:hypothetical protein
MSLQTSAEEVHDEIPFGDPSEYHVDLAKASSRWAVPIKLLTMTQRSCSLGLAGEGFSWANAPST